MWKNLSKIFFNGLITLLPLLITIWLMFFCYNFLDGILGNIITMVHGRSIPGLGLILIVLLILFTGFISPYIFGQRLLDIGDRIIGNIPVVKSIYSSVKQINDVLFTHKAKSEFNRACIFEYPRKGVWTIGFVTSEAAAEISQKSGSAKLMNVFVANTPTPATGFLVLVPESDIKILDMKIDDAFKYVISGGVLKPNDKKTS